MILGSSLDSSAWSNESPQSICKCAYCNSFSWIVHAAQYIICTKWWVLLGLRVAHHEAVYSKWFLASWIFLKVPKVLEVILPSSQSLMLYSKALNLSCLLENNLFNYVVFNPCQSDLIKTVFDKLFHVILTVDKIDESTKLMLNLMVDIKLNLD